MKSVFWLTDCNNSLRRLELLGYGCKAVWWQPKEPGNHCPLVVLVAEAIGHTKETHGACRNVLATATIPRGRPAWPDATIDTHLELTANGRSGK